MDLQRETSNPTDRGYLVAVVVFLLGVATLLPWSFMITASDFWMYKFRNVSNTSISGDFTNSDDTFTPLQLTFNSYLTLAGGIPLVLFLVLNTAIAEQIPLNPRIEWSIFLSIILFAAITCTAVINTDQYQEIFLACVLTAVAIANSLVGVLTGGGTGAVGYLPEWYMVVKATGQAFAGLLACVAQIICLQGQLSPTRSAVGYFATATVVLILTQVGFWFMKKSEFYQFHVMVASSDNQLDGESERKKRMTPFLRIFLDGWEYHIAITLTLAITLTCFPTIAVLIRPGPDASEASRTSRLFVPIICFVTLNVGDCLGRIIAGYFPMPMNRRRLLLLASVLRIVFIPLFLICNVAPENRSLTAVYLPYEWQYVLINLSFGTSNGYLIAATMAQAPKATSQYYQGVAGSMVVLFDAVGILIGSAAAVVILKLL